MLTGIIDQVKNFFVANYIMIIVMASLLAFIYFVYYVTTASLRNLKTEILSTYPFDLFIPRGGTWSVGYFLIMIIFLGLIIIFLVKGDFIRGPL